ncbi:unnamed protein product, partial [Ectocarpus sp. 4 AP-2014]
RPLSPCVRLLLSCVNETYVPLFPEFVSFFLPRWASSRGVGRLVCSPAGQAPRGGRLEAGTGHGPGTALSRTSRPTKLDHRSGPALFHSWRVPTWSSSASNPPPPPPFAMRAGVFGSNKLSS